MVCKSCNEKKSPFSKEHKVQSTPERERDINMTGNSSKKAPFEPQFSPGIPLNATYEELVKGRDLFQKQLEDSASSNFKVMSEGARRFYFEELVRAANCEGFLPMGMSPDQAVVELWRIINLDEFSFINSVHPQVKESIKKRYMDIYSKRIRFDI